MYSASSLEPKRLDPVTESFILVSPFILWVAAFTGISNICCNRWNFGLTLEVCVCLLGLFWLQTLPRPCIAGKI